LKSKNYQIFYLKSNLAKKFKKGNIGLVKMLEKLAPARWKI